MQPFTIHCTTCQRSLRVTSPDAIGQILACPKCGSMVMVEAPPDWNPASGAPPSSAPLSSAPLSSGPSLISSSTFVPPSPAKSSPASATPPNIAASAPGGAPAPAKAAAWKDPPPHATPPHATPAHATPVGEVVIKEVGNRNRTPTETPSIAEVSFAPPTAEAAELPNVTVAAAAPPRAAKAASTNPEIAAEAAVPADGWPRWFLPGVAATVALGVVLFLLRLLFESSSTEQVADAGAPPSQAVVETTTPRADVVEPNSATEPGDEASPAATSKANEPDVAATPNEASATSAHDVDPFADHSPVASAVAPGEDTASKNTASQDTASQDTAGQNTAGKDTAPTDPPAVPAAAPSVVPPEPMPPGPNAAASEIARSETQPPPADNEQKAPVADVQPAPSLQRVPPRQVSLELRLADSIKALEVNSLPLDQFLDLLSEISTIPIAIDLDALEQLNRSPTAPITVKLKDKTVADALEAALGPLGLGYDLERGLLVVGHPQREAMRPVTYRVPDLASDDAALGELAALARQLIAPHTWQQNGGKASMTAGNDKIVIEQTPAVHYKLLLFCEKLRVARGLPLKSRYDPATFSLTTHQAKARKLLAQPITANFSAPQPLAGVLEWLRHNTQATIVVDHAALADAETSVDSHCSVVANNLPLAALLDKLLQPMQLTWRAVDATTIEITTLQAAADRDEIEFYPVRNLAADAAAGQALAEQVKVQLGPSAADPQLGIVVHFDAPSLALIVRAPQRMQAQVEDSLATRPAKN